MYQSEDIFFGTKDIVKGGIEKSVPWDHCFSSLSKPCDAKRRFLRQIFLSHPHTRDRYLLSGQKHQQEKGEVLCVSIDKGPFELKIVNTLHMDKSFQE